MIFQGIRTSIAKQPCIFVIFQGLRGGADPRMCHLLRLRHNLKYILGVK